MDERCCTPLLYGHERGHVHRGDMASELVGDAGIEPVTSSVSAIVHHVADLHRIEAAQDTAVS